MRKGGGEYDRRTTGKGARKIEKKKKGGRYEKVWKKMFFSLSPHKMNF